MARGIMSKDLRSRTLSRNLELQREMSRYNSRWEVLDLRKHIVPFMSLTDIPRDEPSSTKVESFWEEYDVSRGLPTFVREDVEPVETQETSSGLL